MVKIMCLRVQQRIEENDKENIILSVGRFDNVLNAKKQDILMYYRAQMYLPPN